MTLRLKIERVIAVIITLLVLFAAFGPHISDLLTDIIFCLFFSTIGYMIYQACINKISNKGYQILLLLSIILMPLLTIMYVFFFHFSFILYLVLAIQVILCFVDYFLKNNDTLLYLSTFGIIVILLLSGGIS